MKRPIKFFFITVVFFSLTGCFEIKEQISINHDGSGSYAMIMDFSESKRLFQMMIDLGKSEEADQTGFEGNPLSGLDSAFTELSSQLNGLKGVKNAKGIKDEKEFRFGIMMDFDDVNALNTALAQMDASGDAVHYVPFYAFSKGKLEKANAFNLKNLANEIVPKKTESPMDLEYNEKLSSLYEGVTYKMIIRTDGKIRKFSNKEAILSKDESELVFSKTLKELNKGDVDLSNTVRFR